MAALAADSMWGAAAVFTVEAVMAVVVGIGKVFRRLI